MSYDDMYDSNKLNPRQLWRFINDDLGRTRAQDELPNRFNDNKGNRVSNDKHIADMLNQHFCNVGYNINKQFPKTQDFRKYIKEYTGAKFKFHDIDEITIKEILLTMENKVSTGLDGMSNKLLKTFDNALAKPISYLINDSLKQGIFPEALKAAKVVPLYKSGAITDPSNYRPISLLNTISKVYEKVVVSQLETHFSTLFTTRQFGFRKSTSTIDCIQNFLGNIMSNRPQFP